MKKKLFLTGATGKLGSILVKFLEKKYKLIPIGFRNKPKNGYKVDLTKKDRVINFLNRSKKKDETKKKKQKQEHNTVRKKNAPRTQKKETQKTLRTQTNTARKQNKLQTQILT